MFLFCHEMRFCEFAVVVDSFCTRQRPMTKLIQIIQATNEIALNSLNDDHQCKLQETLVDINIYDRKMDILLQ
jgi:hypothetical protein